MSILEKKYWISQLCHCDPDARASLEKMEAVLNYKPKPPRQLLSFLGLTGNFRKFMANDSIIFQNSNRHDWKKLLI